LFYFQYWISTEVVKIFTWVVWDGPLIFKDSWSMNDHGNNTVLIICIHVYIYIYFFFVWGEIFKHFSFSVTYHSLSLCRLLNNLAASFHVTPLFHFISRSNCRHYFFTNSWHNSHKPHASCFHHSHYITSQIQRKWSDQRKSNSNVEYK